MDTCSISAICSNVIFMTAYKCSLVASKLTETVILIRRRQAVARHRSDIAHIVVCIREILPILRDARDQRRGEDGVLRVRVKVGVLSGVVRCADSRKQGTPVPFCASACWWRCPQTPVPRSPSSCGCASFCGKTLFSKTVSA